MEVADVAFVNSEYSLAHPLTEVKMHKGPRDVLTPSNINHLVKQWVVRENTSDDSVVKKRACQHLR